MELGGRIEERLTQLGVSQAELARRAGIPQSTVNSLIRRGRRSSPHLLKIARVLQTTPAYLSGETDDPDSDSPEAPDWTGEEHDWVELLRLLEPSDRKAVLTLTRSLAHSARSPTIHERGREFRAG